MDVTPLVRADCQIVQSYTGGRFKISGSIYETPVFIFPDKVEPWDIPVAQDHFTIDDFRSLTDLSDGIDVVLLGTGTRPLFVPPSLKRALKEQGLSIEAMDTGAACRTYNVLMAEGRRVVAALLPS